MMEPTTADTFSYMVLGYGVILGAIGVFLISLMVRFRNLRRDLAMLQKLESRQSG